MGPKSVPNDRFRVMTVSSPPASACVVAAAGTSVKITSRAVDASATRDARLVITMAGSFRDSYESPTREPVPRSPRCHREDYPVDYSGITVRLMDTNASATSEAIQALSVLGDRFDTQLAVEVSGLQPAELLRALDIA